MTELNVPNLTDTERQLYQNLMHCVQDKSKWVNIVYFLVMHFGERSYDADNNLTGCKLAVPNASSIPVPTPDNPLSWEFDQEADVLKFEIKEEVKSMIVVPGENI